MLMGFMNGTSSLAFMATMINSGKTFNSYGDKDTCTTFQYNFMQLVVNVKGIDTFIGLCLPPQCNMTEMQPMAPTLNASIVNTMDYLSDFNASFVGDITTRLQAQQD